MMQFQTGDILETMLGKKAEVIRMIGQGGQGCVYEVDYDGERKALKWYKPGYLNDVDYQYKHLRNLIYDRLSPSYFLMPLDITEKVTDSRGNVSFGYIMDLREERFREFSCLLRPTGAGRKPLSFARVDILAQCALNIIATFREIHRQGYICYGITDDSLLIDPETGDVLFCNSDGIVEYSTTPQICAKCRYLSPTLVLDGENGSGAPTKHDDRYTMAVILFLLLFRNHPLEGAAYCKQPVLTEQVQRELYGRNPVFIYDPNDDSNRPVEGVHNNVICTWDYYPQFVRDIFIRAFDKEVMHQNELAPIDKYWLETFIRLRSCAITCTCGAENLVSGTADAVCYACQKSTVPAAWLRTRDYCVPIYPGAKIYRCYFGDAADYNSVIATVVTSRNDKTIWGLRNTSDAPWQYTMPDGRIKNVEPGEVVQLLTGAKLKADCAEGVISPDSQLCE